MITKGDEELDKLKGAVASCIDYVEEVCITTNGENKETIKWIAENPKIKHSHLPWSDDFSRQRNFNFSQARTDTDFIIWADSDDVIVNPQLIRKVADISKKNGYDTVFFAYWYGAKFDGEPSLETFVEEEITHYRERLIRPGSIVWKKRIHETPVPVDPDNFKYSRVEYSKDFPIAWLHLGADRNVSKEVLDKRMERNQRLLEMELEEERASGETDPRTILYLMKIYAESEDEKTLDLCINMGEEYLEKSGWDEERATCYMLMSKCSGKLGDHAYAKGLLYGAIKEYPLNPLLYLYLARTCFNLGEYKSMKHWLSVGASMDLTETNTAMNNILEMKLLSAELMLEYSLHGERNIKKAHESARLLNKINPTEANQQNEDYLKVQLELDVATASAHKLINYLHLIHNEELIQHVYEAMPKEMKRLPFAHKIYNKYKSPKVWGEREVCYFASFGGPHFEKWDGNSLKSGIGGSETAVVRLAEEWTKHGYKVTVYCDPKVAVDINGVSYLPYYEFNPKDKFNIFIQWRNSDLASKISAKKFLVDLHDVYAESSHINKIDHIDKIMVKSNFHRDYAPSIESNKFAIISNGIDQ